MNALALGRSALGRSALTRSPLGRSRLARPRRLPLPGTRHGAAFGQIVRNEARLARRQPLPLIGSIGLPVILMIIFGEIPSSGQVISTLGGLTLFDVYLPIIMVLGLTMLTMLGLPGPLVSYRELGVLRRLSTTPVPPSWLLAAQVAVQFCVALAGLLIVNVVSVVAFGAADPKSPGGLALSCLLAIAGLFALGLLIAALAPTSASVNAIGRLAVIPLLFFAGLWLPRALMPHILQVISDYTPLGAAVQAIQDSMQTGFPPARPLLVLVAYAVVFALTARRFFRWE
jgi:ABC-2 type transport system permease protein